MMTTTEIINMLLFFSVLLTAVFAQVEFGSMSTVGSVTIMPTTMSSSLSTSLTSSDSSSVVLLSSSVVPLSTSSPNNNNETCSSVKHCFSFFEMIYGNSSLNETATNLSCPNLSDLYSSATSCLNVTSYDCNSTSAALTSNASYFGLVCTNDAGLQMLSWNNCNNSSDVAAVKIINDWTGSFCRSTSGNNILNCSNEMSSGLYSVDRNALIMPFMESHNCTNDTKKGTTTTPVPLLLNPVGPAAITAIVVLVCLFIVAVLAGFFFWPKCHISKGAKPTPKKYKLPPLKEQVSVAYNVSGPTGPVASIGLTGPQFRGPAAA